MKSYVSALLLSLAIMTGNVSAAGFTDEQLTELGQSFAQSVNEADAQALGGLISARHLAKRIADIAADTPDEEQPLRRSFQDAVPDLAQSMLTELARQQANARFMRVHEFDDMRGPLVRYDMSTGYNYVLLLPVRTPKGTRIQDLYAATNGELLSESIGVGTKLITSPSETFLGKLFGVTEIDTDLVSQFKKISSLRQQGDLRGAYDVVDNMPAEIRNHRLILMNAIQIASQLDPQLYRTELRRLARHHSRDPRAAFVLLDHYFFEEDFDAAMSVVEVMADSYGTDAVIQIFRTNVDLMRGRLAEAVRYGREAVRLEPDNEEAQWTLLNVLIQSGQFAQSVAVFEVLQNQFGYAFDRASIEAEPLYDEFVKSQEFEQWIAD